MKQDTAALSVSDGHWLPFLVVCAINKMTWIVIILIISLSNNCCTSWNGRPQPHRRIGFLALDEICQRIYVPPREISTETNKQNHEFQHYLYRSLPQVYSRAAQKSEAQQRETRIEATLSVCPSRLLVTLAKRWKKLTIRHLFPSSAATTVVN